MKSISILAGVLCVLVALVCHPAAVQAQETVDSALNEAVQEATGDQVGEPAAGLFSRLALILDNAGRYKRRMIGASAEDSLVLALQYQDAQDRFVKVMADLRGQMDSARDNPELHRRLLAIHQELSPVLEDHITELRLDIDALRAQRSHLSGAELAALEVKVSRVTERLDLFYSFAREHLLALETLGEDITEERAIYHRLLRSRAEELSGRLALGGNRAAEITHLIRENPGDADLPLRLQATRRTLDINSTSLATTLGLMEAENIPDKELRTQLVEVTQDLASGIMNVQVAASLLQRAWHRIVTWLGQNGPGLLMKLVLAFVILGGGWLVARLVRKAVDKSLEKARLNISQLLRRTIVNFAHKVMLGLTLMLVLSQFGFSLGPLLAGLGVVGFILGFAMQDSLSNFASGLMILFYRPYDVGDLVEISGVFGKVEHMSMVSTSVLTLDNQKLVVPNSKIWGDVIKNVTDQRIRRVDMVFGISYSDDIPHAEKVLSDILTAQDQVLADPEPMIHLHTLNESSVDFVVRPWVKTEDYWDVYWAVTREVKMRFDAEKISIPFPQRDVHLYREKAAEGEA